MVRRSWARKAVSNVFDDDCDSAGAGAGQLGLSREGGLDRQMLESLVFPSHNNGMTTRLLSFLHVAEHRIQLYSRPCLPIRCYMLREPFWRAGCCAALMLPWMVGAGTAG